QTCALPISEVDPTIPKAISGVVMKCLEIDRDHRFSTAREILEDLGHEMPTSVRTVAPTLPPTAAAPKPAEVSLFQRYRIWIVTAGKVRPPRAWEPRLSAAAWARR